MNTEQLQSLKKINCTKVKKYLKNTFHDADDSVAYAAAFILTKAKIYHAELDDMDDFFRTCHLNDPLASDIREKMTIWWNRLKEAVDLFSTEEYAAYLLYDRIVSIRSMQTEAPEGLIRLALGILDIHPGDRVADFCTGKGTFLRDAFFYEPNALYYGNEINHETRMVTLMRANLLGGNICVSSEDTLLIEDKFDKIFSDFPFGMKCSYYDPSIRNMSSADWMFAEKIISSLNKDGRAVAILTNGSTWNQSDREKRKFFVEQGYIETMIALPNSIFEYTMVATTMVVFSHGNHEITFVDATEMHETGRRNNILSDENISEILAAIRRDHPKSRTVSCSEIEEKEYYLYPLAYTQKSEKMLTAANSVRFSEIIKRITRGSQIKASELDNISCNTPTKYQYLMNSNIRSGFIDENLSYITELAPKYDKYCLKSGDLILSKNNFPIKIAVAEVPEGRTILANGNLYLIELNTEKVNPYYVKAYLESKEGQAALRSICVGVALPNIPIDALKNIRIPIAPMEIQKSIADKYKKMQQDILLLRKKLMETEKALEMVYDEVINQNM